MVQCKMTAAAIRDYTKHNKRPECTNVQETGEHTGIPELGTIIPQLMQFKQFQLEMNFLLPCILPH